mmetsp:Transcript_19376/g.25444  ORF Transcript_19376/g.25444 Transcript_19376/m.25444 type:complete len:192 (+) Transcript_19376:145-720(+)
MSVYCCRLLLVAFVSVSSWWQSNAYRVGDAIRMTYQTPTETLDVLRMQRPLFGISSYTKFDVEDVNRFSLVFEDGIRPLPWIDIAQGSQYLEQVKITFVYSKSGDGTIEHMSSQTTYSNGPSQMFSVEYEWIEEAPVDLTIGVGIMMLLTTITSLVFLIQACRIIEKEDGATDGHQMQYGGGGYGMSHKSY